MKILFVTPYYKPSFIFGGPVNSVSKLAESIINIDNIDLEVYTTNANGLKNLDQKTNNSTIVDGVKVKYFKRYFANNSFFISPALSMALLRSIRKYDIIHVNMWWNWVSIISALIAIIFGKKVVISPRGSITEYIINYKNSKLKKLIHQSIGEWILKKSHFHLTSNVELNDTKKITPVNSYDIIYNLIDLPILKGVKKRRDSEGTFTMIFMSRVHEKKGIELLLNSLALIESPILLKIAGDGEKEYVEKLKGLILELGITSKVEWLGWLDNRRKFDELMKSDLFVLTSYNENFANVVVEALYASTPVLVTNEVGLSDFVQHNGLGWTTESNVAAITETIKLILGQVEIHNNIIEKSQDIVLATFTPRQLANEYVNMYKSIS